MNAILIIALILLTIFPILVLIFIIIPFMFGASFEISRREVVEKMIEFVKLKKGEKVVDLGSGDGRVILEFARKGVEVHGYEINPLLVFWSRKKIKKEGLQNKAFIHWKNFWKEDLSKFDVVIVFQVGYLMSRLERKLRHELKKGARVISNRWRFPNWKLIKKSDVGTGVYLYNN